MKVNIHKGGN